MSWLYTIIFAGLAFSSSSTAVPVHEVCADNGPAAVHAAAADETEKFERSYPLNAGGRVNVGNVNGSITVEAWDRNEVKLEYTKVADTRERLADVEIRIESRPDYFSAETDYDWRGKDNANRWKNGKLNVEFRLMVPRGAVLSEIETVNGSVMLSNFTNRTTASAVNGSVTASNLRGTAKLSTVNGEVRADFDRLESGSRISLETVNGKVNLLLPSDANATVKADSLNGAITNDFGLPVRKGKYVGRDLYGRLGSGDVQIKLESVNGALAISRKNDGRSVSPAVNLLPQKDKDDDDWDGDISQSMRIDSAKLDKQISKSMKETVKAGAISQKALKDAQKEIDRIQPDLADLNTKLTVEMPASIAATATATAAIDSREMRDAIREAQNIQRGALARMADASFFPGIPRVEKKSDRFPVKGVPQVTIVGKGCSVSVKGWDKPEIEYRVTRFTDPRSRDVMSVTETRSESSMNLRVENPAQAARQGTYFDDARSVRIEVFVPKNSNLKIEANGTIRLDGVTGDLQIVGADQNIDVRDSNGKLNVTNGDGEVRIVGFAGDLVAKTGDGEIRMEGDFSSINGQANDGTFVLTATPDLDADIAAQGKEGFDFRIEDIETGKQVSTNNWRFGSGKRQYRFRSNDGSLVVQNKDLIDGDYK